MVRWSDDELERIAQRIHPNSKLHRMWKLEGGISAEVVALEIELQDGQTQKVVVRSHGDIDFNANHRIAADEFKLLQILQSAGVTAPKPYFLDESCDILPRPYIVVEYVEGKAEFSPSNLDALVRELGSQLASIHKVRCSDYNLSFLPEQEKVYSEKLSAPPHMTDESLREGDIRDTLRSAWPLPKMNGCVLLHGDYWPGNVLWKDGRITAVIDWEDAQRGDPLADMANGRLEVLWAFGIEAMQSFTRNYETMTSIDYTNLPYFDLCAALRHSLKSTGWATYLAGEYVMRERYGWFVTQAFQALSRTRIS
jgi:aminoglycoside phosphotransferase (APT) family kinase protein